MNFYERYNPTAVVSMGREALHSLPHNRAIECRSRIRFVLPFRGIRDAAHSFC